MSYDLYIGDEWFNYTSNVAPMWNACYEKGIEEILGLTGGESFPVLRELREFMEDNKDELKEMEPANGWGTYEGALEFVSDLILGAIQNPNKVWDGGN